MAKKALVKKQQRKPKFKVRALHALPPVRPRRARSTARFGLCRICLREMAHAGEVPGVTQGVVVRGQRDDDDRPDRRHAHPLRNANIAFHDDVVMPSSKVKEALAAILEQEGYIERLRGARTTPARPGRSSRSS